MAIFLDTILEILRWRGSVIDYVNLASIIGLIVNLMLLFISMHKVPSPKRDIKLKAFIKNPDKKDKQILDNNKICKEKSDSKTRNSKTTKSGVNITSNVNKTSDNIDQDSLIVTSETKNKDTRFTEMNVSYVDEYIEASNSEKEVLQHAVVKLDVSQSNKENILKTKNQINCTIKEYLKQDNNSKCTSYNHEQEHLIKSENISDISKNENSIHFQQENIIQFQSVYSQNTKQNNTLPANNVSITNQKKENIEHPIQEDDNKSNTVSNFEPQQNNILHSNQDNIIYSSQDLKSTTLQDINIEFNQETALNNKQENIIQLSLDNIDESNQLFSPNTKQEIKFQSSTDNIVETNKLISPNNKQENIIQSSLDSIVVSNQSFSPNTELEHIDQLSLDNKVESNQLSSTNINQENIVQSNQDNIVTSKKIFSPIIKQEHIVHQNNIHDSNHVSILKSKLENIFKSNKENIVKSNKIIALNLEQKNIVISNHDNKVEYNKTSILKFNQENQAQLNLNTTVESSQESTINIIQENKIQSNQNNSLEPCQVLSTINTNQINSVEKIQDNIIEFFNAEIPQCKKEVIMKFNPISTPILGEEGVIHPNQLIMLHPNKENTIQGNIVQYVSPEPINAQINRNPPEAVSVNCRQSSKRVSSRLACRTVKWTRRNFASGGSAVTSTMVATAEQLRHQRYLQNNAAEQRLWEEQFVRYRQTRAFAGELVASMDNSISLRQEIDDIMNSVSLRQKLRKPKMKLDDHRNNLFQQAIHDRYCKLMIATRKPI